MVRWRGPFVASASFTAFVFVWKGGGGSDRVVCQLEGLGLE